MADTSDFRNGMILDMDGEYWTLVEFQHVKPGKGGAFVRTKIKNLLSGQVKENTFRAGAKIKEVRVVRKIYQYLYNSGGLYYMMDKDSYEQIPIPEEMVAAAKDYLKENIDVTIHMEGEKPLFIEVPNFVELEVTETEPGFKGDTAQGGTKTATLETGLAVMVPLFLEVGDIVKVDTRTGKYLARV